MFSFLIVQRYNKKGTSLLHLLKNTQYLPFFVSFSYKKEGRVHLPSKPLTELEGTYTF
jgi:hypothetical protein